MTQQPPIYVCVTNLLESRHQKKTGIPRVEYEVARYLVARGAIAVAWNNWHNRFHRIDFEAVIESITRAQALDLEAICAEERRPHALAPALYAQATAAAMLSRRLTVNSQPGRAVAHFAFRRIAASWPYLSPRQRHALATRLRLSDDSDRLGHFIDVLLEIRDGRRTRAVANGPVEFERDATMMLLGIWWAKQPFDRVAALKRTHGLRFIGMVYDLMPIRRPEFFTDDVSRARFTGFVDGIVDTADAICADSGYVARDVEAYARERGVDVGTVTAVPLCSELHERATPVLSPALMRSGLEPGKFVVMVSTLNPRKNHVWAYQFWRRVVEELGDAAPTLVFAGQRGWRYQDLMTVMAADTLMWNRKLRFVEGPTDDEMAWLYANSAFSLFPSMFEGWGLPITESLSYGKYCLAADNTSLPEAGQGLAFHADTVDGKAWLDEVRRLVEEPDYLAAVNARIAERYVSRSWDDVSAEVLAVIEDVRRRPVRAAP